MPRKILITDEDTNESETYYTNEEIEDIVDALNGLDTLAEEVADLPDEEEDDDA